ncbi:MAG: tRNA (adenosine(37)-N6)-threonylcarbamoyltransferase complex transferase subunit TsaD [Terriglobia bacterium]
MLVLGIESSCDETAAAVVADGERILSNVVASQVLTHARYGGVVPELASREHLRKIGPVVDAACREAGVSVNDVDAVAVTEGPGLIGSLLVGLVYAKALALSLEKPLVGVNHLEGHVHAVLLENKMARRAGQQVEEPSFPNVTLVVSGGHTSLFRVEIVSLGGEEGSRRKAEGGRKLPIGRQDGSHSTSLSEVEVVPGEQEGSRQKAEGGEALSIADRRLIGREEASHSGFPIANRQSPIGNSFPPSAFCLPPTAFSYVRLGQTRDDAAGEAFDKVAKLLALGYPGGPVIDQLSRFGNSRAVDFGHIKMKGNPLDFSFSGLKTAVLYRVRGTELAREAEERRMWRQTAERPTLDDLRGRCSQATIDLIASFQHAVVQDLVERTLAAADREGVESIFVSGGVACNSLLRERFAEAAGRARLQVFFPSLGLSTDNAAMIAAAGFYKLAAAERADSNLTAHASLPLG